MIDLYNYIQNYSESYIDSLYDELISKKYDSIRNCPTYHECVELVNSLNALNDSCNQYRTITPQSQIFERLVEDNDICSAIFRYSIENDYYQINVILSDSNENEITFDIIRPHSSQLLKERLSKIIIPEDFIFNIVLGYIYRNNISVRKWIVESVSIDTVSNDE